MVTALVVGLNSLAEDVIYALPAKRCLLFCADTATLTVSNETDFNPSKTLTLTDGQVEVAAAFIQCTTGAAIVTLKTF